MNAGEPLEGSRGGGRAIVAELAREVPTVGLDATVADAAAALGDAPFVLVTTDAGVVLGKVLARSLEHPSDDGVETVLIEGPTTVRPSESLPELLERMDRASTASVLVTSNQGELVGVLYTEDARAAVEEHAAHEHGHPHHR